MKRLALITLSLVSLITGCASGGHGGNTNNNIIDSLVNASSSSPALSSSSNEASSTSKSNYPVYDKIDIDLTVMSPNLVYSAVYNMVMEPARQWMLSNIVPVMPQLGYILSTDERYLLVRLMWF